MDNIILYLLNIIQGTISANLWLILFICRYIPLKQWAHDEIHSLSTRNSHDKLPVIKPFHQTGLDTLERVLPTPLRKSRETSPKLTKVRPAPFLKISCALFAGGSHMRYTSTIIPVDAVQFQM